MNSQVSAQAAPDDWARPPPRRCSCAGGAFWEAKEAYDEVKKAYDKAVTLCRTKEINKIYPALREAKTRLLAAEMRR